MDKMIGLVSRGQGVRGVAVRFTGRDSHTGTTPMDARRDALVGAARVVTVVRELALRTAGALGTVSRLEVRPGSRAVIPGRAEVVVDIRHPEPDTLDALEAELRREIAGIAAANGLEAQATTFLNIPPVRFDRSCVDMVKRAAHELGYPAMEIVSGAAHDAFAVASRIPTAMVFIPCRNGVSHHPAEYAEPEHVHAGADVLLHAVLDKAGVGNDLR